MRPFAKAYGELEDKRVPSKEYVAKKLSELEGGEFRAEQLSEIVMPVWDRQQGPRLRPERFDFGSYALGARTATLATDRHVQHAGHAKDMKHTKRAEIQDINAALFERYKEYSISWATTATDSELPSRLELRCRPGHWS